MTARGKRAVADGYGGVSGRKTIIESKILSETIGRSPA